MIFLFFVISLIMVFLVSNLSVFVISGSSMEPSIKPGDFVVCLNNSIKLPVFGQLFKITNVFGRYLKPKRGDVICFHGFMNSDLSNDLILKRLVGLSNDAIYCSRGKMFVNSLPMLMRKSCSAEDTDISEEGLCLYKPYNLFTFFRVKNVDESAPESYRVVVPPDHYFILGDNRAVSLDSRLYGPIHCRNVFSFPLFYVKTSMSSSTSVINALKSIKGISPAPYLINRFRILCFTIGQFKLKRPSRSLK